MKKSEIELGVMRRGTLNTVRATGSRNVGEPCFCHWWLSRRQRTGPYGPARPTEFQIYGRVASNQNGDIKLSCKRVGRDDGNKHNCKFVTVSS